MVIPSMQRLPHAFMGRISTHKVRIDQGCVPYQVLVVFSPMKLLAFAASNSRNSINRALVHVALGRLTGRMNPDAEVTVLDIHDFEMPIYSIDRELAGGIPREAREFFREIGESDAVLVSFAEHNGFVTAAWKNIFDWMSRIDTKVWQGKPLLFLAATPGGRNGAGVLGSQTSTAMYFGGSVVASLGIGRWPEAYDPASRTLQRAGDIQALDNALDQFIGEIQPS